MKLVSIEQLEARLSHYLRRVRSGESILVTDRDEVVAELRTVRHQSPETGSIESVLDRLAREGKVTRASEEKRGWSWSPKPLGLPEETVTALLEGLRQDR